jgi:hypothetical protein
MNNFKGRRRYWKLKEEELRSPVWRTHPGQGYGTVVRLRYDDDVSPILIEAVVIVLSALLEMLKWALMICHKVAEIASSSKLVCSPYIYKPLYLSSYITSTWHQEDGAQFLFEGLWSRRKSRQPFEKPKGS